MASSSFLTNACDFKLGFNLQVSSQSKSKVIGNLLFKYFGATVRFGKL